MPSVKLKRFCGQPNDEAGPCGGYRGCGQIIGIGEGIWSNDYIGKEWYVTHKPETGCKRGWIYLAHDVGPNSDLIKAGKVEMACGLTARIQLLYEKQWSGIAAKVDIRNFWAASVARPHDSERLALNALRPFRAYPLIDPGHPSFDEWMHAHPRPPIEADVREQLGWIYQNKASALKLAKTGPYRRRTPGWTELFRGTIENALATISAALEDPMLPFRFDPLSATRTVERITDEQEAQ